MSVWGPAVGRANLALYDDLSGLEKKWLRRLRGLRGFCEFEGLGAGVSASQINDNLAVFVKPTSRKHRLWQCLLRVGRPRAKQDWVFDDMGTATSDQELTTIIK